MSDLTVASFNTHMGRTPDMRPYDPVEVIARLDADVIVLQEALRTAHDDGPAARAARELGYDLVFAPYYRGPLGVKRLRGPALEGELGIALLTRLEIDDVGHRDLHSIPGDPSRRAVIDVGVRDSDGLLWRVHGTHVSWLPHGSLPHLAQLRRMLGTPRPREVVTGDLNMWGPVVSGFMRGWRRAVRGRTWPQPRPHSQLDHILVGPDLDVAESGVLAEGGSDHRAVWARLTSRFAAISRAWSLTRRADAAGIEAP